MLKIYTFSKPNKTYSKIDNNPVAGTINYMSHDCLRRDQQPTNSSYNFQYFGMSVHLLNLKFKKTIQQKNNTEYLYDV